jgi:hypothetical protein
MPPGGLASTVDSVVRGWEGIDVSPHRFGGKEFRWGHVEIGHVQNQGFVDIPFPPEDARPAPAAQSGRETSHPHGFGLG